MLRFNTKKNYFYLSLTLCFLVYWKLGNWDKGIDVIYVTIASCGSTRIDESFNLIKTSLLNSEMKIHFFIFTESENVILFNNEFTKWPLYLTKKLSYEFLEPQFPKSKDIDWKDMYAPCSAQRLFLPNILKSVDSILYIDSDSLVMTDLKLFWNQFQNFDSTQLMGAAQEAEIESLSYYNKNVTVPFYGKMGFNAGILMMNLTRMREFKFIEKLVPLAKKYRNSLRWGDQCLLNALFHKFPEQLRLIDCLWNFRLEHCRFSESECKSANEKGIGILHGSRQVFKKTDTYDEPIFRAVYQLFNLFNFDLKSKSEVVKNLEKFLTKNQVSNKFCGRFKDLFLKSINI